MFQDVKEEAVTETTAQVETTAWKLPWRQQLKRRQLQLKHHGPLKLFTDKPGWQSGWMQV